MAKQKFFLVFLILLVSYSSFAQSSIVGFVVDSISGKGLTKATVMLLHNGKTVKFARTDEKGRFKIDIEAQHGDELQATLMGYGKKRQPVGKDDNVIRLVEKAFQLKEVKVKGSPVLQRQDTIVYDLTRYATDRDNNLKDVLKKLPGVEVGKDGKINYNGKAISRFTIEGLDLSKGQYNKLTENVRAKDVKKAEVVEHDQPIKALRNRVFTDNVGMNIVLKDSARDQLAVTLRPYLLVDHPTNVGGDAVGMQIGKKKQMEYTAQYDRTGRDLQNQFSIFYNAWDFASTADMPKWFTVPSLQAPIDEDRLRRNTSQAYSVDYISKGKDESENSLSVSYSRNVIRQHTQNVSQYLLDGETPTETTEDQQMTLKQDAFSIDYNHRINAENHYGNVVVKGSAEQEDGISGLSPSPSPIGRGADYTKQEVRAPGANLTAAISQTYTLKSSILQWQSTVDYHYSKDKLDLTQATDSAAIESAGKASVVSPGFGPPSACGGAIASNLFHTAHSLSWNRQLAHWHRDYNIRLEAENLNVESNDNTLVQVGTFPSWYYKDDDWRISFTPGVTLKRYTHQNATMLLPKATIYINRNYGNRKDWNFGIFYNESASSWSTLAIDHHRTDYRTWVDAPDFVPRTRILSSSYNYNYKRAIYQFFSNLRLNYSRNWNEAARDMVINNGEYHYTWVKHNTYSDNLNGSVEISKGWRIADGHKGRTLLKTNFTVKGNYVTGQQYSSGSSIDFKYLSYSFQPQIILSLPCFEIDYNGMFTFNRSKTADEWMNTLADFTQRLALTSTIKDIDITLSGVHYHNEILNSSTINTLLADARLTWRLKKVRLSAELRNIFNKKTYEETTYSGIGIFSNRYWLRPRELMVNAQFSL